MKGCTYRDLTWNLWHFEKVVTNERLSLTIGGFKGRVDCSKIGFLQFVRGPFLRGKTQGFLFQMLYDFKTYL